MEEIMFLEAVRPRPTGKKTWKTLLLIVEVDVSDDMEEIVFLEAVPPGKTKPALHVVRLQSSLGLPYILTALERCTDARRCLPIRY